MSVKKNFIVVFLQGGLGNQLYQFAFGKALSKKLNCNLLIDNSYFDQKNNEFPETFRLNNFSINSDVKFVNGSFKYKIQKLNLLQKIYGNEVVIKRFLNFFFNKKIDNIFFENFLEPNLEIMNKIKENSAYLGYWEHINFFDHIKEDLLNNLNQKNLDIKKINDFQTTYLKKNSLAIHFSDTRPWPNIFDEIDDQYYINAIKYFENLTSIENILIFAKNKKYALNRLSKINTKNKLIYLSDFNFSTMEEFYILRNLNNYIISRSTFGWWAAYLSYSKNKNVIVPKKWWAKNKNNNINEGRIANQMRFL